MISLLSRHSGFVAAILVLAGEWIGAPSLHAEKDPAGRFSHSAAEHFYEIAPAPVWVKPLTPDFSAPLPFEGPIRPGVFFRLVDYQNHAEAEQEYFHYACEFLTVAGVHDESEFEIEFDPAYQSLAIHRIRINRADQWIDILDPATIRITRPEDELGEGLLDGHVSVLIYLEDIRPGDRVEYDYTLSGRNPVFEGYFYDTFPTEWESSVQQLSYRLLRSPDRTLSWKAHGPELSLTEKTIPSGAEPLEEWTWERKQIPPRILENALPSWFRRFGRVEISEFENWQSVAAWGARQYRFGDHPPAPELATVIDEIAEQHTNPEDRAIAAIRFVQDSIRYLGIEDGPNAFRPVQPNQCFERRFGDCKDKTVLLGQILDRLGIESDPVFVHHALRHTIDELLPSPFAFDHVVIRIKLPGDRLLWCDATDSHQGGNADTLAFPEYGLGLVLSPETTELTALPVLDPLDHQIEVVETYHLSESGEPAELEVSTTYTGSEADIARFHLESSEPASLRQLYLDYYRENYPDIEQDGPIEPSDDREANRLVVTERFRFPDFWEADTSDPGWYSKILYFQGIRDLLSQPDHHRRSMPFRISHPNRSRHEIRLYLPGTHDDWAGYFDEENFRIESEAGVFERLTEYNEDTVFASIVTSYQTKADFVSPEGIEAFSDSVGEIYELTSLELWELNEAEEKAAAMTSSPEETSEESSELAGSPSERKFGPLKAVLIGVAIALVGLAGLVFGILVTFLIMRRKQRKSASSPALSAPVPVGPSPPPLPRNSRP